MMQFRMNSLKHFIVYVLCITWVLYLAVLSLVLYVSTSLFGNTEVAPIVTMGLFSMVGAYQVLKFIDWLNRYLKHKLEDEDSYKCFIKHNGKIWIEF